MDILRVITKLDYFVGSFLCILWYFLKILSRNKIMTPFKDHGSVANMLKTMRKNLNVDLVNKNVYQILSMCF